MPDLRSAAHLPNNRPDGRPLPHGWLPRQRRGTTPQMVGRYPDYDVLENAHNWDDATRETVLERLEPPGELSFFSEAEGATARAFCDTCTAQDDEPRIPVLELIDVKLSKGQLDGYQYADMPDDRDTWHVVLRGLDFTASSRYGAESFAALDQEAMQAVVDDFSRSTLQGGPWETINVKRAWSVVMRMICVAFYSHPWAWNEIGFGGPAYPEGFMRLGPGPFSREPHERRGATDEDPGVVGIELEEQTP